MPAQPQKGMLMHWMLMPLRRYAEFSGRSRRKEYWMFILFQMLVYVALMVVGSMVGAAAMMATADTSALEGAGGAAIAIFAVYGLFSLAMLIPTIAVTVRRLHDTNRTGWWFLAPLIPYAVMAGSIFILADSPDMALAISAVAGIVALVLGIVVLVFMFLNGTSGPNKYGPDPKAPNDSEVFA